MSSDRNTTPSMGTMEMIVSLALVAVGLLVAWDSYRLGAGWSETSGPRSGYFPFRLGLILIVCGAWLSGQAFWKRQVLTQRFIEPAQVRPVLTVAIPTVFFVLVTQWLGIYVASAIFVFGFMIYVGPLAWWKCLLVALVNSVLLFYLFEKRFFVLLPKGAVERWLGL